MPEELRKLLTDTSAALGVEITEAQAEAFQIYKTLLQDWNTRINLTAITEDSEIMIKHFADSLSILPLLREKGGQTLVDVGTGAGFPGLPVAICCPEMSVTLVDSLEKRVRFLREVAEKLGLPFVQEVYAERLAVGKYYPDTDAVIELGGEDAKILFLTGGFEMRMNGTCAGGTGAFIDQMASLMQVTPGEMNDLAAGHETVLPIASRCGVFAKSDVQPLLNQGARREDVSAGIFRAVVNQTIAGLAQGREITGKILYLGGPLSFLTELRKSFDGVLKTTGICPENSLY